MPRPCASSRAPRTACAEQQLDSPSFSGSDHSSSVTPTASRAVLRATSSAATALSTPPLIATSVRRGDGASARARARPSRARGAARRRRARRRGAWRRSARRAPLRSRSRPIRAASSSARAAHQADGGAAGGDRRAAAARVEARVDDLARRGCLRRARSEMRIRSPQAAPPAAPVHASAGSARAAAGVRGAAAGFRRSHLTRPSLSGRRAQLARCLTSLTACSIEKASVRPVTLGSCRRC